MSMQAGATVAIVTGASSGIGRGAAEPGADRTGQSEAQQYQRQPLRAEAGDAGQEDAADHAHAIEIGIHRGG
jgi:NAD(P)-dependent dehydrogenase (short-subunit alcohol dehydrogenase family)